MATLVDLCQARAAAAPDRRGYVFLGDGFEESVDTGRKMVQERPLMAVGAALAVGVLLGVILGRTTNGKSND